MRYLLLPLLLVFIGCKQPSVVTTGVVYTQCNIGSFESDYNLLPQHGDNSFDVVDDVTYYGYCGQS